MVPCVALITMLCLDSQRGHLRSLKEIAVSEAQAGELLANALVESTEKERTVAVSQKFEVSAKSAVTEAKHEFTGVRGRILSAYLDGVNAIEKTGAVTPQATFRESLKSIEPLSATVHQTFAELTALAEIAVYSNGEPDEKMAVKAERLAAAIRQHPADIGQVSLRG